MRAPGNHGPTIKGLNTVSYYNWSGYADDNSSGNTYTKVIGSWTQPTMTCGKEGQIAVFWVGLDGFNNSTVEQDGTYGECYGGVAYYGTWWEMYPTNSIQTVGTPEPGDAIQAKVIFVGGRYHLTVTDTTTTSASFTTSQTCATDLTCARASAEWIGERVGETTGLYPLAHFSPWHLKGATVTSGTTTGPISAFPDDAIQMVDTFDSYNLATVGALSSTGRAFTDTWNNSY